MRKKKVSSIGLLFFVLLIGFSASLSVSAGINQNTDKVSIRLAAYGSYKMSLFLQDAVAMFNDQYPKIQVKIEVAPIPLEAQSLANTGFIPGYEHRLLAEFAANDSPDVFFIPPSRAGLYRVNGALIELSTCMNKPDDIYGVMVGNGFAGISSQTKHLHEASLLLGFLEKYTDDYSMQSRQKTLDKAAYDFADIGGLDGTLEDFIATWNFVVMSKHCEDLIFFPHLFVEYDSGYHTSFKKDDDSHYLFVNVSSSDSGTTIDFVRLAFIPAFIEDPYLANLFREAVDTLIRVVDLEARENGSDSVLQGLGANLTDFDFHFFNQMGYYYHNGIQYRTLGPALSASNRLEYQIVCKKSPFEDQNYQRRKYPPNL